MGLTKSLWSLLTRQLPNSTCCSLDLCCIPVRFDIALWTLAHRCMEFVHKIRTDSVTPRPRVRPPRLFRLLFKTCSMIKSVRPNIDHCDISQPNIAHCNKLCGNHVQKSLHKPMDTLSVTPTCFEDINEHFLHSGYAPLQQKC